MIYICSSEFVFAYFKTILVDTYHYHRQITDLLLSHIPNIVVVKSPDQRMLTYMVPKNKRRLFQGMLLDLESHYAKWGIRNLSLLSNDLKDIYMNLTLEGDSKKIISPIGNVMRFIHESSSWKSSGTSFLAVLYKKIVSLSQLNIPCITIGFVVLVVLILYELTKRLHPVSSIDKGMIFGLQMEGDSRALIHREWRNECSFIEVNEVNVADSANIKKDAPIYYTFKKFNCFHDISYLEYLESDFVSKARLGAVELLDQNNFQVWINEYVYHSAPLMVNLAENLIIRYTINYNLDQYWNIHLSSILCNCCCYCCCSKLFGNNTSIYVVTVNKPMTVPLATRVNLIEYQVYFLRLPVTIGIIMPFILATFIIRRVQERGSHFYTLQKISGMRMNMFWLLTFIWDMLTYFVYSLIFLLVMMFTTVEGFDLTPKLSERQGIHFSISMNFLMSLCSLSVYFPLVTLFLLNLHAVPVMFIIYILSFFMTKNTAKSFLVACIIQLYSGIHGNHQAIISRNSILMIVVVFQAFIYSFCIGIS